MQFLTIYLMVILGSVLYGLVHDQITIRICEEYFTVAHPHVFDTTSPTMLALGWGVIATWWVGAILGIPVACASRLGDRAPLHWQRVAPPLAKTLAITGAFALLAGLAGGFAASQRWVWLLEPLASSIPQEKHTAFMAVWWAHNASYDVGAIAGVVLCIWLYRRRKTPDPVAAS
jgi:hypothetical protein